MSTTEGEHWERQRKFFHDHLTDLVDGKGAKGFHEVIMDEIQDMKLSLAAKVNYNFSNLCLYETKSGCKGELGAV